MASEFRYSHPAVDERDLVILISQSGETADTLAALKEAKRLGARTLAIVNVVGSAIAKAADQTIYTWAGPEIAVATTKAFSTQLAVVYLLTLHMAGMLGSMPEAELRKTADALLALPEAVERMLIVPLQPWDLSWGLFVVQQVFPRNGLSLLAMKSKPVLLTQYPV